MRLRIHHFSRPPDLPFGIDLSTRDTSHMQDIVDRSKTRGKECPKFDGLDLLCTFGFRSASVVEETTVLTAVALERKAWLIRHMFVRNKRIQDELVVLDIAGSSSVHWLMAHGEEHPPDKALPAALDHGLHPHQP
jgi:hypothetical protein